ncbi:hypothetical protein [Streptomyces lavendofoliae]|uniref:hypothetical protein n=1 Tax=Streptomyces lavendofoliae TaxID=67314 RepID=UPI00300E9D38
MVQTAGGYGQAEERSGNWSEWEGSRVAEGYRVEWTYEGSSMASYDTYDLVGAERYRARIMEDPIAQDVRIVEAEYE